MSERHNVKLGDILSVRGGKRMPAGTSLVDTPTSHPYLRIVDFRPGGIDDSGLLFVPNEVFPKISRYIIESGDLFISIVGTIGIVGQVPQHLDGANLTENAARLFDFSEVADPGFVKYFLMSDEGQRRIDAMSVGSTQKKLALFRIKDIEVPLPTIEEQREIASILGALDDKIEVNRKTAATLEEMARALYRSWFVDFDPVHAKAAGSSPAHMDTQTAALFPDRFGKDGLPEGWELGTLSDLIDFNPKAKLPKGTLAPYLDMKALPTAGMSADAPYDRAFTSGTKFRARDTLLARITPCLENGKTAMVDSLGEAEVGWGSTEFIVMRAKDGIPPSLPYCVARDASFREDAIASMTGSSGRQRADAKTIAAIEAAVPTEEIVVAFGDTTMPMIERIHQIGAENQILATLRDTLLPRLMSGELRVGEAKKQVEAVA